MNQQVKLQSRLIALPQGLYLVRIKPGQQMGHESKLGLYPSPLGSGKLFFLNKQKSEPVAFLQREEDEVVVAVKEGHATMLVADFKHPQSTRTNALEISVEKLQPKAELSAAGCKDSMRKQNVSSAPGWLPLKAVFEGGIEVDAPHGSIGSPGGTKKIMAFALDSNALPEGVDLVYACRKAGEQDAMFEKAGNVLGLTNKSLPITAVSFIARGRGGEEVVLTGQVVFAGQPPLAIVSGKELNGPTGQEALVALRVSVQKKTDTPGLTPSPSVWNDPSVLKSIKLS